MRGAVVWRKKGGKCDERAYVHSRRDCQIQTIWPADRIRETIAKFKPPHPCYGDAIPRITLTGEAKIIKEYDDPLLDGPAHLVVHRIPSLEKTDPGRVGEIIYALPINGYWSPAAVGFFIRKVPGGLALQLYKFLFEDLDD